MADRCPEDPVDVLGVTIRYRYEGRVYRMTIPVNTTVDAIFLDCEKARMAKEAGIFARDDAAEDASRSTEDWMVPIHPAGDNWAAVDDRHGGWLSDSLERLEEEPGPIWSAEHTKHDVCVHDERCMWFCLDPR